MRCSPRKFVLSPTVVQRSCQREAFQPSQWLMLIPTRRRRRDMSSLGDGFLRCRRNRAEAKDISLSLFGDRLASLCLVHLGLELVTLDLLLDLDAISLREVRLL